MLTSKESNNALENINNQFLEIMNDKGILASYLLSPLSRIINPAHTTQYKLVKVSNSNRVNDLLINKTIPVTIYNNLLSFCDTDEKFESQGNLSKLIDNKNYNADLANLQDKKIKFEFAKETYFDEKTFGKKSSRDITLQPPARIASRISTKFLPENPYELFDKIKLLVQEKQAGNNSNIFNEEIMAIADKV